jgi:hypothetical protein
MRPWVSRGEAGTQNERPGRLIKGGKERTLTVALAAEKKRVSFLWFSLPQPPSPRESPEMLYKTKVVSDVNRGFGKQHRTENRAVSHRQEAKKAGTPINAGISGKLSENKALNY